MAYVLPDSKVSFGEFLTVYEKVVRSNGELRIGLVTDNILLGLDACPAGYVCRLDWPDHGYKCGVEAFGVRSVRVAESSLGAPDIRH